ncbi:hypothetical protein F441_09364 [Phytophthora nicotianae CJ01A1]|uniref:Uncharacterized protein n=2 Tax=Phytophthora nicotianae TaxID=4792 RepID=W2WZP8_PHYNI|nr:hypothetical protein F441_09364 [Phytophthora nicotianae CJ01A1]
MTSVHLAISKLPWSYELTNFPKTSNHINKAPPVKLHPDAACNYCNEVFTNAQPSRHLYPHIQVCSRATTTTKKRWAELASQKKRKASFAEIRSPSKSRRTSYGDSVRTPPPKADVSKAEEESFHLDIAKAFSHLEYLFG